MWPQNRRYRRYIPEFLCARSERSGFTVRKENQWFLYPCHRARLVGAHGSMECRVVWRDQQVNGVKVRAATPESRWISILD